MNSQRNPSLEIPGSIVSAWEYADSKKRTRWDSVHLRLYSLLLSGLVATSLGLLWMWLQYLSFLSNLPLWATPICAGAPLVIILPLVTIQLGVLPVVYSSAHLVLYHTIALLCGVYLVGVVKIAVDRGTLLYSLFISLVMFGGSSELGNLTPSVSSERWRELIVTADSILGCIFIAGKLMGLSPSTLAFLALIMFASLIPLLARLIIESSNERSYSPGRLTQWAMGFLLCLLTIFSAVVATQSRAE